jgi:hypothetical protein
MKKRRLLNAFLVLVTGAVALATSPGSALADDESPDGTTISSCRWCRTSCPADLIGYCQSHCGTSNTGSACIMMTCPGSDGHDYPYAVDCV